MKLVSVMFLGLVFLVGCSCSSSKKDDESPSGNDTGDSSNGPGDGSSIAAPANLVDGDTFDPVTDHYTLTWASVDGAASYEIAVGSSAGASDVLDWYDVGDNTSVSTSTLSLPEAGLFYASVRSVASDGSKSDATSGDGWQHLICPTNWTRVSGSTTAGLGGGVYLTGTATRHDGSTRSLSDFCVMTYEMKLYDSTGLIGPVGIVADGDVGGAIDYSSTGDVTGLEARSVPEGRPWVQIKREDTDTTDDLLDAERACSNLSGTGLIATASLDTNFHMINNAQWQAIARDIESNADNFVGGIYNRGNSFGDQSCDASSDNVGNGCVPNGGAPHDSKRTHTLTNGEVIWDISGNAWEWVIDDVDGGATTLVPNPVLDVEAGLQFNHSTCGGGSDECFSSTNRLMFGPSNNAYTSTEGAGYFYGGNGAYAGSVVRGGRWTFTTLSGIFYAHLDNAPSNATQFTGTRCAWSP